MHFHQALVDTSFHDAFVEGSFQEPGQHSHNVDAHGFKSTG